VTDRSTVGVVFVNFHSEHLITERARYLKAAGFSVGVADNSGTFQVDGLDALDMGGNVGFGVACNGVVAHLPDAVETLCLHNPDLTIQAEGIDRLVARLRAQSHPGVVSPAELQHGIRRSWGYQYPGAGRELAVGLLALRRSRRPVPVASSMKGRRFGGGGLWVVDRQAFEDTGGFDDSYFLYGEDLDLWHRLTEAGYDAQICADVDAVHDPSTGSPMGSASREILRWLGVERFAERFGGPGAWRRMRLAHRAMLPLHRRRAGTLGDLVREEWRGGHTPEQTQARVRRHMEHSRAGCPA
jgi:GT2 family glycosyltransferase